MSIPRNKLGAIFNRAQGLHKKVLCICSAGILRSPTAAIVLQRQYGYNTRACGANTEYALIPMTPELLMWADEIVCMEAWQAYEAGRVLKECEIERDVYCLHIEDIYDYMSESLQDAILKSYGEIVCPE